MTAVAGPHRRADGRGTMRAAALCAWAAGVGFGLPGVYGAWYLATHDRVWSFLGFPTYGAGHFETLGIETGVPLTAAFVLVCAAECVVGWMLWRRTRGARATSVALLPLELVFWIGFVLPFGFVCGTARTVLVLVSWSSSRRAAALQSRSPH